VDVAEAQPAQASRGQRLRRWLGRGFAGLGALLVLTLTGLWAAVGHTPLDPAYAGPEPLPGKLAERCSYPEHGTAVDVVAEFNHQEGEGFASRWVQFEVTTRGFDPHLVQVIYYRSLTDGRLPAVVVTPILGGDNEVAKLMAEALAANGVHAAIVLRAGTYLDPGRPDANVEAVLRTSIVDRRRAVDWLQQQAEVDPERIGAFGVSMGGIITAAFVAVEPRVRSSVMVMAGGDLPNLVRSSEERSLRKFMSRRAEQGLDADAVEASLRRALDGLDPLALGRHVDARAVLLFTTRWDASVPAANQERLYDAIGRPERYALPTGHYSAMVYLPYLRYKTVAFLRGALGGRS